MSAAAGVAEWAHWLGVTELRVQVMPVQVNVAFRTAIGGRLVQVWGCVDALRRVVSPGVQDTTISAAELARFAEQEN